MADDDILMMRGRIFGASREVLLEIAEEQEIDGRATTLTRPEAVKLVDGWFMDILKTPEKVKAVMVALSMNFDPTLTDLAKGPTKETAKIEPTTETTKGSGKVIVSGPGTMFKKDLKISGQVDAKTGITFMSLKRQIDTAQSKGYPDSDIIDAVIKAIPPTSGLRRYLEGMEDLTLITAKNILRAHYNEKSAAELYNELGQATQGQKEAPTDFLMRCLDLRNKILFASKESSSGLVYDPELVRGLFERTVATGLQDLAVRQEFRPILTEVKEDETLLEELNAIVSREAERRKKFNMKDCFVKTLEKTETPQSTESQQIKTLQVQLEELKVTVAKLSDQGSNRRRRWGCRACEQAGTSEQCRHCYKCGETGHLARDCKPENEKGLPRKGAKQP